MVVVYLKPALLLADGAQCLIGLGQGQLVYCRMSRAPRSHVDAVLLHIYCGALGPLPSRSACMRRCRADRRVRGCPHTTPTPRLHQRHAALTNHVRASATAKGMDTPVPVTSHTQRV